jgi:hypothetical protein
MLLRDGELKDEERQLLADLCQLVPEIKRAQELAHSFIALVKERKTERLRQQLIEATRSAIPEVVGFARDHRGLRGGPGGTSL